MDFYDLQPSSAQNYIVEDEKLPRLPKYNSFHFNLVQILNDEEHHTALQDYGGRYLKLSWREKRYDHLPLHGCAHSLHPGGLLRTRQHVKYSRRLVRLLSSSFRYHTETSTAPILEKGEIWLAQQGASQYIGRDTP